VETHGTSALLRNTSWHTTVTTNGRKSRIQGSEFMSGIKTCVNKVVETTDSVQTVVFIFLLRVICGSVELFFSNL
jgi:hypothetical protein